MQLTEWQKKRVLLLTGGFAQGGSPEEVASDTFVMDRDTVRENLLRAYDVWYKGDGNELLNLYNRNNMLEYQYEPWYSKNQRGYFWSVSSTEDDIKRTHSGKPADIVNTLVGIVGVPEISCSDSEESDAVLKDILKDNGFWATVTEVQMPMTLVEGWGCFKTSWDLAVSDHPTEEYYRAQDVDFVWRGGGKPIGIIFRNWYQGEKEGERYLVTEVRYLKPRRQSTGFLTRDLHIETRLWKVSGGDHKNSTFISDTSGISDPRLKDVNNDLVVTDFNSLLAQPCVFYKDATDPKMPGKSIYQNKLDLFDDLDQELSQQSNCIAKSTPEELFNTDFLEKDQMTGLPIMPNRYDRKYTTFSGQRGSDGTPNTNQPVVTTQPTVDFNRYGQAVEDTISQILSGIMSPATMGIGVAVQSTSDSQREKEKVTIATRNHIIDKETGILQGVFSDLMSAEEYLRTGMIYTKEYNFSFKWSKFADTTFENKASTLSGLLDNNDISPKLYLSLLYGETLTGEDYQHELEFLEKAHNPDNQMGRDAMGDGMGDGMGQPKGLEDMMDGMDGDDGAVQGED